MSALLKQILRWLCPHRFSWPHSGIDGQDYQVCLLCGTAFEYDVNTMRRTGRLVLPHTHKITSVKTGKSMNRVGLTVARENCCCNIASLTMSAVSRNRVSPRYDFDPKTEFRKLIEKDARVSPNLNNPCILRLLKTSVAIAPLIIPETRLRVSPP